MNTRDLTPDDLISELCNAAKEGNLEIIESILKDYPNLINEKDINNLTPLCYAAVSGHLKIVDFLIKMNAEVDHLIQLNNNDSSSDSDSDSDYDLHESPSIRINLVEWIAASGLREIAKSLLKAGANKDFGHLDILKAAKKGDLKQIQQCLYQDPTSLNIHDEFKRTPLYFAAANGHIDVVDFLIKQNPLIDTGIYQEDMPINPTNGQTPLCAALIGKHIEVVKLLLDAGCSTGNTDHNSVFMNYSYRPLDYAAQNGFLEGVKLLVQYDPNLIEQQNKCKTTTVLIQAAIHGHANIVEFLIQNNINVDSMPLIRHQGEEKTALYYAIENGYSEVVALLLNAHADTNKQVNSEYCIHIAVKLGHTEIVKLLLKANPDLIHVTNKENKPPLFIAAEKGYQEIVEYLVNQDADVYYKIKNRNPNDDKDRTALDKAIEKKRMSTVEFLLHKMSYPKENILNLIPFENIHLRASQGDLEFIKKTIQGNPSLLEQPDALGRTPLFWAIVSGQLSVVTFLLSEGANANCLAQTSVENDSKKSLLQWSIYYKNPLITKKLLEKGADPNFQHKELEHRVPGKNHHAIPYSIKNSPKDFDILISLATYGAHVHEINSVNDNLLHHILQYSTDAKWIMQCCTRLSVDLVSAMLKFPNNSGELPIHKLLNNGSINEEEKKKIYEIILPLMTTSSLKKLSDPISFDEVCKKYNPVPHSELYYHLQFACEVLNLTREHFKYSSSHPQLNGKDYKYWIISEQLKYIREQTYKNIKPFKINKLSKKSAEEQMNYLNIYLYLFQQAMLANCDELSVMALKIACEITMKMTSNENLYHVEKGKEKGIQSIDFCVCTLKNGDHAFCKMGLVICDPWAGVVYPVSEKDKELSAYKNIEINSKNYNIVVSYNSKYHKLESSAHFNLLNKLSNFEHKIQVSKAPVNDSNYQNQEEENTVSKPPIFSLRKFHS